MNFLKYVFLLIFSLSLFSCITEINSTNDKVEIAISSSQEHTAKMQSIEVTIKGMTCEIGCAKFIESKTHKLKGMTFAKVSFEHGLGQFTFDSNKISIADIEKHINGIAGGELYKVTSSTVVDTFTNLEKPAESNK